jgi:hypothetical protein
MSQFPKALFFWIRVNREALAEVGGDLSSLRADLFFFESRYRGASNFFGRDAAKASVQWHLEAQNDAASILLKIMDNYNSVVSHPLLNALLDLPAPTAEDRTYTLHRFVARRLNELKVKAMENRSYDFANVRMTTDVSSRGAEIKIITSDPKNKFAPDIEKVFSREHDFDHDALYATTGELITAIFSAAGRIRKWFEQTVAQPNAWPTEREFGLHQAQSKDDHMAYLVRHKLSRADAEFIRDNRAMFERAISRI